MNNGKIKHNTITNKNKPERRGSIEELLLGSLKQMRIDHQKKMNNVNLFNKKQEQDNIVNHNHLLLENQNTENEKHDLKNATQDGVGNKEHYSDVDEEVTIINDDPMCFEYNINPHSMPANNNCNNSASIINTEDFILIDNPELDNKINSLNNNNNSCTVSNKKEETRSKISHQKENITTLLQASAKEIQELKTKGDMNMKQSVPSSEDSKDKREVEEIAKKLQNKLDVKCNNNNIVIKINSSNKTINSKEENDLNYHDTGENLDMKLKLSHSDEKFNIHDPNEPSQFINDYNYKQKNSINLNNLNKTNYSKFDLQQMSYDLIKQYSKTKITNVNFMQRMNFDIFKRQTKEQRINNLLEKNKLRHSEIDRVNAFNRLIEDANRRLEASERLEALRTTMDERLKRGTHTDTDWDKIYNERFLNYKKEKEDSLEKKIIEKEKRLKEEEDKIIEEINKRTKKVPKSIVDKMANRMYGLAEKIKIKREQKKKEIELIFQKQEKENDFIPKLNKREDYQYNVKNELLKPTSAYLGKVKKKLNYTCHPELKINPSTDKFENKKNGKKDHEKLYNNNLSTNNFQDNENIIQNTPIPTNSNSESKNKLNLHNELMYMTTNIPYTTKNSYNNKTNKNFKYIPDLLAKDLVNNILKDRLL